MTDTVTAKLAEWEALVEGATEGPWGNYRPKVCATTAQGLNETLAEVSGYNADTDAEFIAASRTAMPALLGFVREVRALHASSEVTRGVGQIRDGAWTAYCEEDVEDWPCPTERAARKWIGGEG